MAKIALGLSVAVIFLVLSVAMVGCDSSDQVELAKTDVKFELPKEGKKREELPKSLRPPEKGTSYGITHDPSKGAGR